MVCQRGDSTRRDRSDRGIVDGVGGFAAAH